MNRGLTVFRVDGGPQIGMGHVVRCLSIARRLERDGWRCAFAISDDTARHARAWLGAARVAVIGAADEPQALRDAFPEGCEFLLVDHYDRDAGFEVACRSWAHKIGAIDDAPTRAHDCDLLVDPSANRGLCEYDGRVPAAARRACGSAYVPLRDEFFALRVGRDGENRTRAPRLLVSLGGSDVGPAILRILDTLLAIGTPWPTDIVVSGNISRRDAIADAVRRLPKGSRMHEDTDRMAALTIDASLAIGAAGMSAWERACLGLPSLVVEIAENQRHAALALERAGAAIRVGRPDELAPCTLGEVLRGLQADASLRTSMSRAARRLCDGLGARRIALAVAPERDRNGAAIELRPAVWADNELMLAWQAHPDVRRFARKPNPPTRAEHEAWLARRLDDARTLLSVIERDGYPAGVLRLDCIDPVADPQHWEVSILVEPELQGRGIAAAALRAARRLLPEVALVAEVLPGNDSSHRLFRGAGYTGGDGRYVSPPTLRSGVLVS